MSRPYNLDPDAISIVVLLLLGSMAAFSARRLRRYEFLLLALGDFFLAAWVMYYHCFTLARGIQILLAFFFVLLIVGFQRFFAKG